MNDIIDEEEIHEFEDSLEESVEHFTAPQSLVRDPMTPRISSSLTIAPSTSYSLVPVFEVPAKAPPPDLREIYQTYASLFPNPNLNTEQQERDRLLQALSAADHAVSLNQQRSGQRSSQSKRSWWWTSKTTEPPQEQKLLKIVEDDDDRLLYTERLQNDSLLPLISMEYSAIPIEAHALARYRMANIVNFVTTDEDDKMTTMVDLVDGRIFQTPTTSSDNFGRSHRVDLPDGTSFVAVSSTVLVYGPTGTPVARIPPSPLVLQKLAEHYFLQEEDDTVLLHIVGLKLLENEHHHPDCCLVIARLGGFLEFVTIVGTHRPTAAITTAEYHTDLLGMELVDKNSIVVYGGRLDQEHEPSIGADVLSPQVFTVWKYDEGDVQLLHFVSLDLPSSSIVFDGNSIVARYWRTPRSIRLRTPDDGPPIKSIATTSVSVPTPIVQIAVGKVHWVVVDGLGGITFFDVAQAPDYVMHIYLDRTTASKRLQMATIASAGFQNDDLFLLSKQGDLYCWRNETIVRIHVSPFACCLLPTVPIRIVLDEPETTKIVVIQTTIGTDTIGMLIQSGNIQKALSVGKHLSTPELEACRKQSWEESKDLDVLSDIKDTEYLVQQALTPLSMTLGLYRSVCSLAIKRISTARLGELLSLATSVEEGQVIARNLNERIIASGTYDLLCSHLGFHPSVHHFLEEFFPSSMEELALHFAKSGDIAAVSLFWFRHPPTTNIWRILDSLPLALDPRQYCHLLPYPKTSKKGPSFFVSAAGEMTELSRFPAYVESSLGLSMIIDDVDCGIVQQFRSPSAYEIEQVESWLAQRANALSSFVGSITFTNDFIELAMIMLGGDDFVSTAKSQARRSLDFLRRFNSILVDSSFGDALLTSAFTTLTVQALGAMDTEKLVSIVLSDDLTNASTIQSRYKLLLVPLLELRQENAYVDYSDLDKAVVATFLGILEGSNISSVGGETMSNAVEIVRAAGVCDDESDRVIKNPHLYVDFALSVVKGIFEAMRLRPFDIRDARAFIEQIWQIYECLPENLSDWEIAESLSSRCDKLYIDLIGLDLCLGWPDTLSNLFEIFPLHFDQLDENGRTRAGHEVASLLCRSFCDQLTQATDMALVRAVLTTLVEDLKDFDRLCFQGMLELPRIVNESLARPLLNGHYINVLGVLFEISGEGLVDAEVLSQEVLSLYKAALYSEKSSEDEIRVASQCHEVLGRWMPSIVVEFAHSGKFLAASHLISSVLTDEQDTKLLLPQDIRRMNPIEVIDFVLKKNQLCFIQHCREWIDVDWAAAANETIRRHFERRNEMHFIEQTHQKLSPIPPLPGIPVFRLAELIGLEDTRSIVAVKYRIIVHGIDANLHGASAAICRTLLADVASTDADCIPALEATARTVSSVHFRDNATKRELCLAAMQLRKDIVSHRIGDAVETITRTYEQLEHDWTACCLFEAGVINQVQKATQNDYSISMIRLLGSLQRQMSDLVFDDELMLMLARFLFFWCVGRGTKPVIYPYHPLYATATNAMLSLAAALTLHVNEISKFEELISEITGVFSIQIANAEKRLLPSAYEFSINPDPNVVSRLIKRGYSECGARRAVVMTQNSGFNTAAQWAVQHSLDENFDDPILLVRPIRDIRLDNESMELCKFCFMWLQRFHGKDDFGLLTSGKDSKSLSQSLSENIVDENAWLQDDGLDFDSQEVNRSENVPQNPIEPDFKDSPILGGWDDHDEIDLDAGFDEVQNLNNTSSEFNSKDENGGWGNDLSNLNTILEGEHETSAMNSMLDLDGMTPQKEPLEHQNEIAGDDVKTGVAEEDGREHVASMPNTEEKQIDRSGWDVSIDFTETSDSVDATNYLFTKAEQSLEREKLADKPIHEPRHQPCLSADHVVIPVHKKSPTGQSTSCLHIGTDSMSHTKQMSFPTTDGLLDVNISSAAKLKTLMRPDPSIPCHPPRSAPLPRSKLLEVGQEVFANARKACSPSVEERHRLIEQGRAFLKQVKASSSNGLFTHADRAFFFTDTPRAANALSANLSIAEQPMDEPKEEEARHQRSDWSFEA